MNWNGHKAAVSLTFDDGLTCQLEHAVPAMDALGIKGTFFLPTDCPQYPLDIPAWQKVSENGHEIGSHSVTHRKAAELSQIDAHSEARKSKAYLRAVFPGQTVESFCYPYTDAPAHLRDSVGLFYKQARGGRVAREDKCVLPGDGVDLLNVPSFHTSAKSFLEMEWGDEVDRTVQRGGWLTLMFHGVGPDATQWDNVPTDLFKRILRSLSDGSIWIAPFGTVADYYRRMK